MRPFLGVFVLVCLLAGVQAQAPVCAGQYRTINVTPHYQSGNDHQTPTCRHRNVRIVSDVLQINPAYFSAYSPDGYDSATQADVLAALRQLTARLDAQDKAAHDALLKAAAVSITPTPQQPIVPPPAAPTAPQSGGAASSRPASGGGTAGLAVVNAKCAACHQAGKLAPDQRFTLLDAKGALSQLTDRQKLRVMTKVYTEQMPPPKNAQGITPVTDAEFAAVVDLLQGQ